MTQSSLPSQPLWLRLLVVVALTLTCFLLRGSGVEGLTMPRVFGSHMVLQREPLKAQLWGTAAPLSTVVCSVDSEKAIEATADAAGHFLCQLPPHPLSWNRTLSVTADQRSLVFTDVAFGDVVLCLGSATHPIDTEPPHPHNTTPPCTSSHTPLCCVPPP